MKNKILNNWNVMRILRLVLGVGVVIQGIITRELVLVPAGLLVAVLALAGQGCCSGSCAINSGAEHYAKKNLSYEENNPE